MPTLLYQAILINALNRAPEADSSSGEEKDSEGGDSSSEEDEEEEETKSNPGDDDANTDFSLGGLLDKIKSSTHSPGPNPHPSPKVTAAGSTPQERPPGSVNPMLTSDDDVEFDPSVNGADASCPEIGNDLADDMLSQNR